MQQQVGMSCPQEHRAGPTNAHGPQTTDLKGKGIKTVGDLGGAMCICLNQRPEWYFKAKVRNGQGRS